MIIKYAFTYRGIISQFLFSSYLEHVDTKLKFTEYSGNIQKEHFDEVLTGWKGEQNK